MSDLSKKTIRPGSLNNYAYYYSNRRPPTAPTSAKTAKNTGFKRTFKVALILIIIAGSLIGLPMLRNGGDQSASQASKASNPTVSTESPSTASAAAPLTKLNYCADNTEAKFIKISVEKRHLWACEGTKMVHDTPVITGLRHHPETETPLGTYKIYGKMTNTTLTGQDSRGAWRDPVYYWMPFLDNQYGTYGFHDATWRNDNEFGDVSPDSDKSSHGCIELPLASSKWLYDWAPVGTVVTVEA